MTRREDRATITAIIGVSSATKKERCSYQQLSKPTQCHHLTIPLQFLLLKQPTCSIGLHLSRLVGLDDLSGLLPP